MRHVHRLLLVTIPLLGSALRASAQPKPMEPRLEPRRDPRIEPGPPEPHVGPHTPGADRPCISGDLCNEIHWNFEPTSATTRGSAGNLQGWSGSGPSFRGGSTPLQPTYGSNVTWRRELALYPHRDVAGDGTSRMKLLTDIGGDYWDTTLHTGYEGDYWLSTKDRHPTSSDTLGAVVADGATGELASPGFWLNKFYVKFLGGAGCDLRTSIVLEEQVIDRAVLVGATLRTRGSGEFREVTLEGGHIELEHVATPTWAPVQVRVNREGAWVPAWFREGSAVRAVATTMVPGGINLSGFRFQGRGFTGGPATRSCAETMTRVTWNVRPLLSRPDHARYRIRMLDESPAFHITGDDFWITNREAVPEPAPARPLFGYADLHTHPAAHLAYGGLLIAGTAAGTPPGSSPRADMSRDLDTGCSAHLPDAVGREGQHICHDTSGAGCNTAAAKLALGMFTVAGRTNVPSPPADELGQRRTRSTYARSLASAPSWYNASHQMMHIDWIRRAYQGGLRLLVADAVNNRAITWLIQLNPGDVPPTDSDAIEAQFRYIRDLARANASWMEIVLSPAHARRVIGEGKLAIVLGTEVDTFGECALVTSYIRESGANVHVTEACSLARVREKLEHFYRLGQRKMNPIHLADNGFGGMAVYSDIFNFSSNWYNRGDINNYCADPRMIPELCPAGAVPTSRDVPHYTNRTSLQIFVDYRHGRGSDHPAEILSDPLASIGGNPSDNRYRSIFGWTQVRDGSASLGTAGFRYSQGAFYPTISHNPLPGFDSSGCTGMGFCANKADIRVDQRGYGDGAPDINAMGLTANGREIVNELMRRGMLIDIQHMSELAVNEVLGLVDPGLGAIPGGGRPLLLGPADSTSCGQRRGGVAGSSRTVSELDANVTCREAFYPVMSSHGGLRFMPGDPVPNAPGTVYAINTLPAGQNENSRSLEQLRRIYQIGGMVGLGTVGGTKPFAAAYQEARRVIGDRGIAFGSDLNGGDGGAPPRLLEWSCSYGLLPQAPQTFVRYGGMDPSYSMRTCSGGVSVTFRRTNDHPALAPMGIVRARTIAPAPGTDYRLDINKDGMANIGMYPDYLQDLRAVGLRIDEMSSLLQSADRFVTMWEKACGIAQRPGVGADRRVVSSNPACRCDPGVPASRDFCPPESPGME